jgi:uncharacterized protein YdaL
MRKYIVGFCFIWVLFGLNVSGKVNDNGSKETLKRVLIVTDSAENINKISTIEARELYNLLGHFKTNVVIRSLSHYTPHEVYKYDIVFYIGYKPGLKIPQIFISDILAFPKKVVWINSGLKSLGKRFNSLKYGFSVTGLDSTGTFNVVKYGNKVFTRGNDGLFQIKISNSRLVSVMASAYSDKLKKEIPYAVKSGNFYYVADVPFLNASITDRYLVFADLLHTIMGENHPENHVAIVRIEDVTLIRDPKVIREIADILYSRQIPFLIGVVPFYVDPTQNKRLSLSECPDLVEALKYCVSHGATIVLHGVTHQYKGITGIDFEFWDGDTKKPIADDSPEIIAGKIEAGIHECVKNGIYPLMWETPHYMASTSDYKVVSRYFSTSIERRMLNDDYRYGQFFPYIINKDIYGQKINPENLGYIPLLSSQDSTEIFVRQMISNAKSISNIRDGYASFFFHPFLNLTYLKEIVDSITDLGFKFVDLRQQNNWVKSDEVVIMSGSQRYNFNFKKAPLYEVYYKSDGETVKNLISKQNYNNAVNRKVNLKTNGLKKAEPIKEPQKINPVKVRS